jgi:hypothetical protein
LERKRIKPSVVSATEAKNRFGAIIKRAYSVGRGASPNERSHVDFQREVTRRIQ